MPYLTKKKRWMPWELCYFDGHRKGLVGILPVMNSEYDSFIRQEYLCLYRKVERLPISGSEGKGLFMVEPSRRGYRSLDAFATGVTAIRPF